jgi:hypothetical protein
MSRIIEAQRAIIEGAYRDESGRIFEVRAKVVVPPQATILDAPNAKLVLRGYWSKEKGYVSFGLAPLPMGPRSQFDLEVQPDPEDDPNIVYTVRPRTIILEDQKIFGMWSPTGWGPGDPDNSVVREYQERYLKKGSFDFEAMYARVGSQNPK